MSGRSAFQTQMGVSRETLVSKASLPQHWARHFLDSAQILEIADPDPGVWADFGTGGGFPGLIVAILATERRPDINVVCVESDTRKATFLRTVVRETGLDAQVISKRIEDLAPLAAKTVSARALAPLGRLLGYAQRHLAPGGKAIFLKGAGYEAEVAESLETWSFEMDTYPSKTDPSATILKLGDIQRV